MNGHVLSVTEGRTHAAVDGFLKDMDASLLDGLKVVAMDMWPAYEHTVRKHT